MAEPKPKKPHKVPKQDVRYSRGMLTRHCSLCMYFRSPHACERVAGHIDPNMWCNLFHRAASKEKPA